GIELLPERPQFTEELSARSGRALSVGRRATGPSAHGTDEQSGQHDNSAAQYQTLSFRLHSPPLFVDFLQVKHASPASSTCQSSRGAFCFSTSLISPITISLSTALTMSYTVSNATPTAVSASISTPVRPTVRTLAQIRTPGNDSARLASTSTRSRPKGGQRGISAAGRSAARATATSPPSRPAH